jgi:hypothetical protein
MSMIPTIGRATAARSGRWVSTAETSNPPWLRQAGRKIGVMATWCAPYANSMVGPGRPAGTPHQEVRHGCAVGAGGLPASGLHLGHGPGRPGDQRQLLLRTGGQVVQPVAADVLCK